MGVLSGIMIYLKAFQKQRASETVLSEELLVGAVAVSRIECRFICVWGGGGDAGTIDCTQAKPGSFANFQ